MDFPDNRTRCGWVTADREYVHYHDHEWGVPVHDDRKLFEMLILEGAQAGLSWITILKRRGAYRTAYDNFDPDTMAGWDQVKIKELLHNPSIIRNRLKIEAAKANARAFLRIVEEKGSFDGFIWSFTGNKTIQNHWQHISQIPVSTGESETMSIELKKRGFKFVGPTICYAFMQSVGMVNDHTTDCFRYEIINKMIQPK